jgi:hypothetical protein
MVEVIACNLDAKCKWAESTSDRHTLLINIVPVVSYSSFPVLKLFFDSRLHSCKTLLKMVLDREHLGREF